jgi:hypothetical protein
VIRYVIVAQLTAELHTPSVYGLWKTREAAEEQMGRWERRIERSLADGEEFVARPVMSVEPVLGKAAAGFERDFETATRRKLAR